VVVQPFSHFDRAYLASSYDAGRESEFDGDCDNSVFTPVKQQEGEDSSASESEADDVLVMTRGFMTSVHTSPVGCFLCSVSEKH